ncbi:amino acid transporter heavy chain SLC3A1-like [Babylonia areolata]|uniref:amino acid transporter heavy chain SLC3A1-like n=1 Tax=Babylonia areolata TaxID=304850 RepID=UPI003FD40686
MADNGAVPEPKEKVPLDDPEAAFAENELDDSKAKFINGGMDDTKVVISGSDSNASFVGLGKEELKRYAEDPFWVRLRWILFILFWVGWLAMLVSAIVIIVLAPRCPTRPDLKWYHKDVAYNVYSKSFFDGDKDQDGVGDLEGIQKKEGYVGELNANVLWLSSIFSTEGNNDRAILDHKMLDKKFGTIDTLRAFCKKLLKQGKQVIIDLIPNQTSRNHTWFMESKKEADKYIDYYVWSDTNPGWKRDDGTDMWELDSQRQQYFLSQFPGTADLNLTNEDVIAEFKDIIHFWAGVGVNGFHINDLEYLAENSSLPKDNKESSQTRNFAANSDVVHSLRSIVDGLDNKPGREKLLFGTVTSGNPEVVGLYKGGDGKKGLHVVSVVLNQLTRDITATNLENALVPFISTNDTRWLAWRLTMPEAGTLRVSSRVGMDRMIVAHALQALLPGSSIPYYGDEIAMGSSVSGRETVSPMQWSKEDNAGFTTGTPWTPVNPDYMTSNVDSLTAQLGDNKLMDSFKALNELRAAESLQFGKTRFCSKGDLFIFSRHAPGFPSFVVVVNLGRTTQHVFQGDDCVGDRAKADLKFISHNVEHQDSELELGLAISVEQNEVMVMQFPA